MIISSGASYLNPDLAINKVETIPGWTPTMYLLRTYLDSPVNSPVNHLPLACSEKRWTVGVLNTGTCESEHSQSDSHAKALSCGCMGLFSCGLFTSDPKHIGPKQLDAPSRSPAPAHCHGLPNPFSCAAGSPCAIAQSRHGERSLARQLPRRVKASCCDVVAGGERFLCKWVE